MNQTKRKYYFKSEVIKLYNGMKKMKELKKKTIFI